MLIRRHGDQDLKETKQFAEEVLRISKQINYDLGVLRALVVMGRCHEQLSDYEGSIGHYMKALEISDRNNGEERANILVGLGANYYQLGEFELSLNYSLEALQLHERNNEEKEQGVALMHIGSVYSRLNDLGNALDYYQRALESMRKKGNRQQESSLLGNMGGVYANMGNVEKALEFFNESLRIREETNDNRNRGALLNNIGQCYVITKDYEKAKGYFYESIRLHNEFNNRVGEASALINMGEMALLQEKPEISADCLHKALVIAIELKLKYHSYHIHEALYKAYTSLGDHALALKHHVEFHRIKEEVHNQETSRKVQNIQHLHQLENARKESEIERLRNVELKKAYEEVAEKTKEIQDSIRYSQRIQHAMYPLADEIGALFPNSFGVRLAKHVVSGDFVWCASRNGRSYMVLADCTGHGIPGAFMSMIGIEKLNQAVYGQNCILPSEILRSVNQGIKFSLKQNSDDSPIRDGMDLAVCAFDFASMKLTYAGANRPLYHIRNGELIEVAPTKSAVGGLTPNEQLFPDNELVLQKGDAVYMFTDGYADQFGGPNGKKFSTRRFKELLLSICTKDEPTQSKILRDTLSEWKNHPDKDGKPHEQTDDITIIGITV